MEFQQKTITVEKSPVLLDCCTIVGAMVEDRPNATAFKQKIARRKDLNLIVPDIVISEVARIARLSPEAAEEAIRSFSNSHEITRLDDKKTLVDAIALSLRYDYCHYPDSIYLVHARNTNAVLVTYDRKLREVARLEGIMACSPDNFRIYGQ